MITVNIIRENEKICGFSVMGHAGFDEAGKDIVCAAVSILVINTINSIEKFTDDDIRVESGEGLITCIFNNTLSEKAAVLFDSMMFGLENISSQYGDDYIKLIK